MKGSSRFFMMEIVLLLCTCFFMVLSSPTNVPLQSVNESLIQSALHSLNENSPTHHMYTSGHLISAQKLEEFPYMIYRLTFNLNPACKEAVESCPGEVCIVDLKQDELGIIYVQKDSIQCTYSYPQSSGDNAVQEQSKQLHNENGATIESLNKKNIGNGTTTGDQNDATFVAKKATGSNYCPGCPFDLNPQIPGFLAFNKQIEKQMDEAIANDFKHMVVRILRASSAVPPSANVVQYYLLVEVGESFCLKSASLSDCTLQSSIPTRTCLVTFEEKPWKQNSRRITKNNCTIILDNNDKGIAAENLVNESYTVSGQDARKHDDNAYEGLKNILLEDFIHTSLYASKKHEEPLVTEQPFVKSVLNKTKDDDKFERFVDKDKEFGEFLENFGLRVETNNSSHTERAPSNVEIILSENVSTGEKDKNFNIQNNIINEIIDKLDINSVQKPNDDEATARAKRETHLIGSPTNKNVTDPEIVQYANLGLNKLSQLSKDENEPTIVEITEASVQVVSGLLYKVKAKIGVSNCPKGTTNNCQLKPGSDIKDCLITVWSQPWLDHGSPDVKVSCTLNERKKRSLKGAFYTEKMLAQAQKIKHERMFEEFIVNFNKRYSSDEEKDRRFKIFESNLKIIQKLNTFEQGTAEYGVTMFADLTPAEFKMQYLGLRPDLRIENQIPIPQAEIPNISLPIEFDWRHYNVVTPVKDQGSCGSCWAFSVTGNVEGQYAIKHGKLLSLSEQELVDCDKLDDGCSGGLPDNAYRAIEKLGGLELESDYPYEAENEKCHFNKKIAKVEVVSALNITSNETQMAQWLVKNGPISIGINANAMQFYFGGISHPFKFLCDPDNLDHGVLIVGYGIRKYPLFNKKLPYWIIKNSWGPRWGEQGYYRVYRGDGTCGLNQMPTSAVVA